MSTWNANEIRYIQEQNSQTGKFVEQITNEIYEHVQSNPDSNSLVFQNSYDNNVVSKLVSLGYSVEQIYGGVYKDQIWIKVSW